jgi:hypothetical protein
MREATVIRRGVYRAHFLSLEGFPVCLAVTADGRRVAERTVFPFGGPGRRGERPLPAARPGGRGVKARESLGPDWGRTAPDPPRNPRRAPGGPGAGFRVVTDISGWVRIGAEPWD